LPRRIRIKVMRTTGMSYESIPTRESLLGRLKEWDDQDSWRDFYNTYWRLIYSVARKSGLSEAEAADALQETVIAVARKMNEFKYDPALGSFKGWLLKLTQWRIADQFRKRQRHAGEHADDTGATRWLEQVPDVNAQEKSSRMWEEEWENNLMAVAIERLKEQTSPRQFQMFQLYVLKQWPVGKVAEALGVSSAQVYVAKHRILALLTDEVNRLVKSSA
jgi:RNA polymerase sigma factor (sigma-70 family)